MGAKATKIEGSYLPDTPTLNKLRLANQNQQEQVEMQNTTPSRDSSLQDQDPRSPNGCRTPLNFLQERPKQKLEQVSDVALPSSSSGENAFAQFRKRLMKGFSLNDPRSPQLNRTPLILDEVRSLNMDDTFADLFVDTRAPAASTTPTSDEHMKDMSLENFGTPLSHNNSSLEIVSLPYDAEDTMPCEAKLQSTPMQEQNQYDPRSPSIGVERTPIIFCDDAEDEAREAQMLEQILETLTLNLSHESSMASCASASAANEMPPANKHLERVRLGNKRRVAPRKPVRSSKAQIYVDKDLDHSPKTTTTPLAAGQKRTPLSCVKNRQHLRSRSVEKVSGKSPQLPPQSFDDQFNPSNTRGGGNVPSLRILLAGEDSLDNSIY